MITDIEEETQEIEWFGVDYSGEIGHFASGGRGFIPPSVKASRANLDRLTVYFLEYLTVSGDGLTSSNVSSGMPFLSETFKTEYVDHLSKIGAKGLYSFDCIVAPVRPSNYFIVARPTYPLTLDRLPSDIKQIISFTLFNGIFGNSEMVHENEFD